jgi:hypothetical protein
MFECLLGIILFVAGIIWLMQLVYDDHLNSQIWHAQESKGYSEYAKLISERARRDEKRRQIGARSISGTLWMDRIFVLDAAEHGVFAPGAEFVFEDPSYAAYDDDQDELNNYDEDIDDEFVNETQQYDQYDQEGWYPGDDYQPG